MKRIILVAAFRAGMFAGVKNNFKNSTRPISVVF